MKDRSMLGGSVIGYPISRKTNLICVGGGMVYASGSNPDAERIESSNLS